MNFLKTVFAPIGIRESLNAFFSYAETIDIYHCLNLLSSPEKDYLHLLVEKHLKFENWRELDFTVEKCVEGLEMAGNARDQSVLCLFLLQMGLYSLEKGGDEAQVQFSFEIDPKVDERLIKGARVAQKLARFANSDQINTETLFNFSQILKTQLQKLSEVDKDVLSNDSNAYLDMEFETKIALNNMFLLIILNSENPTFMKEITSGMYSIEDNSFKVIKLSLDLAIVPIKKCLILFYTYLYALFGQLPKTKVNTEEIRIDNKLRELVETHSNLGKNSPVEDFYRRHIFRRFETLVVGILRILLTTCPTANRGSGGIDLQREWVSSLKLIVKYPEIYHNFIENSPDESPILHKRVIKLFGQIYSKKEREERKEVNVKSSENSSENSESESNSEEESADIKILNADLAVDEIFKHENYRHSLITAKYIALLCLFIQKHFGRNHPLQGIYLGSLVVDANGILVLLKFINQDFHSKHNYLLRRNDTLSIICPDKLGKSDQINKVINFESQEEVDEQNKQIFDEVKYVLHDTIRPVLNLMYSVSYGQFERIDKNLIQYKAIKIMKRIADNFKETDNFSLAYMIIKIQIKYIKDKNMKLISKVYENVDLSSIEDWICQNEEPDDEELTQKELNEINKEFNIKYYYGNLERLQEEQAEEAEGEGDEMVAKRKPLSQTMNVTNEYYKVMLSTPPLTQDFKNNYEQWLEDEVYGYYD